MFRLALYLVFALSGTAGLLYETIWSRYLGLFVGHSAYAQIIVLAVFLGGMSLGATLAGQRSHRLRDPLLWYAGIELLAGLIGLFFHTAYIAATDFAHSTLFPALAGTPVLSIAKWSLACSLILPQSILLGASFPFMSAGLLRRVGGQPGRVLSLLYFTNSLGAAGGALLAGFWLVALVGLPGTVLAAAVLNIIVAAISYLAARSRPAAPPLLPEEAGGDTGGTPHLSKRKTSRHAWSLLLGVSFGTAVASFIYEIAWIRMLSLVIGSATHSFELMLSAFILGLALGAFWVRRRADRFADPLKALGVVQWAMGFTALATLPIYIGSFSWMADLLNTFAKTDNGYTAFNLARYGICLAVMLPSTFCAGITLPLITRTLYASGHGERAIGWVYGINTCGSIVGVVVASLILLPLIGLKALLTVGAGLDMLLGVLIFSVPMAGVYRSWRIPVSSAIATALIVSLVSWGVRFDQSLLASGVYRYGVIRHTDNMKPLFNQDGRTATVFVGRDVASEGIFISTNGKPDASAVPVWFDPNAPDGMASLAADNATQVLAPLFALAYAPHAESAAVIGQGSGMSSHFVLGSPKLSEVITIEIEREMIEGSRFFYPANRRVFDDPRSKFVIDDAKSYFAASQRSFDLILSEPSNPWVSGVASLFTEEFYAKAAPLLSERGVFGQWMHIYEMNDYLVLTVLAALHAQFRSYAIFLISDSDILIIASKAERLPDPDWTVFQLPEVANDLRPFAPFSIASLESTRILNRQTLVPLLDTWEGRNSDFFPLLDLGAEKTRYLKGSATGFLSIAGSRFNPVSPLLGYKLRPAATNARPIAGHPRIEARARGAEVRSPMTAKKGDKRSPASAYRFRRVEALMAADHTPSNWHEWVNEILAVESDLHGGTAGVADEEFYSTVHQFLDRHDHPPEVCAAVLFLEGHACWDFAAAASAADRLLPSATADESWVPVALLRDGAVLAKLLIGDSEGAHRYNDALTSKVGRRPDTLPLRLLAAYLESGIPASSRKTAGTKILWQCAKHAHGPLAGLALDSAQHSE